MDDKVKKISCDPSCGFAVQSHDEDEVIEDAKKHMKMMHDQDVSDAEAKKMMTEA